MILKEELSDLATLLASYGITDVLQAVNLFRNNPDDSPFEVMKLVPICITIGPGEITEGSPQDWIDVNPVTDIEGVGKSNDKIWLLGDFQMNSNQRLYLNGEFATHNVASCFTGSAYLQPQRVVCDMVERIAGGNPNIQFSGIAFCIKMK